VIACFPIGLFAPTQSTSSTTSSFVPTSLAGLELWDDASDAASITAAAAAVSRWADKSGSANDATQATAADQPTLSAASIDGLPAVVFDGTNDSLTLATPLPVADVTIAAVVKIAANAGGATIIGNTGGFAFGVSGGQLFAYTNRYSSQVAYVPDGQAHLFTLAASSASGGTHTLYVDGVAVAGGAWTSTGSTVTFDTLGTRGVEPLHGGIGELMAYSRCLTGAELDQVHAYSSQKWGTP